MAAPHAIDPVLLRPLYTAAEVAALLGLRPATVDAWHGHRSYRGADGSQRRSVPLLPPATGTAGTTGTAGREPSVLFIGLVEAYVLALFSAAGISAQRPRPSLSYFTRELGTSPLTTQALATDGPTVVGRYSDPAFFAPLLDEQCLAFRPQLARLLAKITYREGRAGALELPRPGPPMVLDPRVEDGRPSPATGEP